MNAGYHSSGSPGFSKGTDEKIESIHSPRKLDSNKLFDGQKELIIMHAQEQYRLRITRHDKLILTK